MTDSHFFKTAFAWLAAAAVAAVAVASFFAIQWRRQGELRRQLRRLAAEIIEVASSIRLDLNSIPVSTEAAEMDDGCRATLDRAKRLATLPRLSMDALDKAIGELHEEHRRVVNLRSEVDVFMASLRRGKTRNVSCRFTTSGTPLGSRWSSTGSHPSPSGFA